MMERSPIQTGISFNLLPWFGIPRNPVDAIIRMGDSIQPVIDVMSQLSIENQEIASGTGTVALGLTALFTNNAALTPNEQVMPRLVWSCDMRLGSALGVGIQVGGRLVKVGLVGPGGFNPITPLSEQSTFNPGEFPIWGVKFPTNAPLVILPGEAIGYWNTSLVGASPNFTNSVIHRILKS